MSTGEGDLKWAREKVADDRFDSVQVQKVSPQIHSGIWNMAISKSVDIFCIMARENVKYYIPDRQHSLHSSALFEYENKM